jgi:hypothetical protein
LKIETKDFMNSSVLDTPPLEKSPKGYILLLFLDVQ